MYNKHIVHPDGNKPDATYFKQLSMESKGSKHKNNIS